MFSSQKEDQSCHSNFKPHVKIILLISFLIFYDRNFKINRFDYSALDFVIRNQNELAGTLFYLVFKIQDFLFKIRHTQMGLNHNQQLSEK